MAQKRKLTKCQRQPSAMATPAAGPLGSKPGPSRREIPPRVGEPFAPAHGGRVHSTGARTKRQAMRKSRQTRREPRIAGQPRLAGPAREWLAGGVPCHSRSGHKVTDMLVYDIFCIHSKQKKRKVSTLLIAHGVDVHMGPIARTAGQLGFLPSLNYS